MATRCGFYIWFVEPPTLWRAAVNVLILADVWRVLLVSSCTGGSASSKRVCQAARHHTDGEQAVS